MLARPAEDVARRPQRPTHTDHTPRRQEWEERETNRIIDCRVAYTIDNGELVVRVVHVGHR
ncbi:type II toxin-antitoxin system RelE/ParE family toxin [Streptomyces xanthophaeus]|nr:type II toxin-antitoxin system RelE/ParE family toxin [Streptomyces xanthophaeus]